MKKLVIISVLFVLLSVVTPVYAGSIDGLWTITLADGTLHSFAMARENSGTLLIVILETDQSIWDAYWGSFDGTTSHMTTLFSLYAQVELTFELTSSTSGSGTITNCMSIVGDSCPSIGTVFSMQKLF